MSYFITYESFDLIRHREIFEESVAGSFIAEVILFKTNIVGVS